MITDSPTTIVQQHLGHFDLEPRTSKVKVPLVHSPISFRVSNSLFTGYVQSLLWTHGSLLTSNTFLGEREYLRYHNEKVPLIRGAFGFDPLVRVF